MGLALSASLAISIASARPSVRYFPAGVFEESREHSDFVDAWYSGHLAVMGEPSLLSLSGRDREVTAFRLLWLPSFDHPVCVRIERSADGVKLHARALDGQGGYEPGLVAIDRSLRLSGEQWSRLLGLLEENAFWELPTRIPDGMGCDGDQLIVEGVKEGRYHVVDRWEPDPLYKELCESMLALTNIDVSQQWQRYHSGTSGDEPE